MRVRGWPLMVMAAVAFLLGCGSDVDSVPGGGVGTGAGSSSGVAAGLTPPILMEVAPFAGMLRVAWQNKSTCDAVVGERRTPTTEFGPVFEVPGTDTATVDADAYENITYSYRLRCKRGEAFSDYSNEKTANPADG